MRPLLVYLLFLPCFALAQTTLRDPVAAPDGILVAHFSETIDPANMDSGTKLAI